MQTKERNVLPPRRNGVKVKLHPRSLEDHILLRKIVGTARGTLFFEAECSLHRTVHVIPTIVLRVKQQLTH